MIKLFRGLIGLLIGIIGLIIMIIVVTGFTIISLVTSILEFGSNVYGSVKEAYFYDHSNQYTNLHQ